jgi:hypothetical protein
VAGALAVVADGARHNETDRQGSVHALLPGRSLHEISTGHHADKTRASDVTQGTQLAGGKDGLDVRIAAGFPHCTHLVVERSPVLRQHVSASDHDIDLLRTSTDRRPDLGDPLLEG